ncbi:glycerophosphodiester phosphodiesterase [Salinisphaera sp. T31B1]|uniref:glycerophosphodiester phosphodiesterase n=1 Tax=Salinisphaera sp. T31B1 TaxID=727963 RepID=UPI003340DC36
MARSHRIRQAVDLGVVGLCIALGLAAAPLFGAPGARHAGATAQMSQPRGAPDMTRDKIVIAHRGASGYLPEHTLPAYAMAYALGADFIEPDLVMTADHRLICLHDIHLESTTDVAQKFPDRARDDGRWYAADFTLAEIESLDVVERTRPDGRRVFPGRFNDRARGFKVPTLVAVIEMVQSLNRETRREVGLYPETKNPAFHDAQDLPLERVLLERLAEYGYVGRDANVFVQSFDANNLREMREVFGSDLPQIQLIEGSGEAFDAMVTPAGLDEIATYADGIGPDKRRIAATDGALVVAAHRRGLLVHPYTFRADQLPAGTRRLEDELRTYYHRYDVDGLFTDFTDIAVGVIHPDYRARLYPD